MWRTGTLCERLPAGKWVKGNQYASSYTFKLVMAHDGLLPTKVLVKDKEARALDDTGVLKR